MRRPCFALWGRNPGGRSGVRVKGVRAPHPLGGVFVKWEVATGDIIVSITPRYSVVEGTSYTYPRTSPLAERGAGGVMAAAVRGFRGRTGISIAIAPAPADLGTDILLM